MIEISNKLVDQEIPELVQRLAQTMLDRNALAHE